MFGSGARAAFVPRQPEMRHALGTQTARTVIPDVCPNRRNRASDTPERQARRPVVTCKIDQRPTPVIPGDRAALVGRRQLRLSAFVIALILGGCSASGSSNGAYTTSVAQGLRTRLSAADAVAITRTYLDQQRGELAAPELHSDPHVEDVWAVTATAARRLDGCIPPQSSDRVVWITRGTGDYLNLHDYPWSLASRPTDDPAVIACEGPGPAGVIVIDDGSGEILGVYPLNGDQYPHPSP